MAVTGNTDLSLAEVTQGGGSVVLGLRPDQGLEELGEDAAQDRDQDDLIVISVEIVKNWQRDDGANVAHSFTECVVVGELIDPPVKYPLDVHHLDVPVTLGGLVHDEDDQDHQEDVDVLVTRPLPEGCFE